MRKVIAAILTVLMLFPLAACSKSEKKENTDHSSASTEASTETAADTSYVYEKPDRNYQVGDDRRVVRMLIRSQSVEWHVISEGSSNSGIDLAVLKRNSAVEEAFGVKFDISDMNGYYAGQAAFKTEIRTSNSSGDDCYDIVSPAMFGNDLIIEGIWSDLASAEYLNVDKGWWLPTYTEAIKMNDKIYTITGDLSVDMLRCMTVVYFNKEMYDNIYKNNAEFSNPYELVRSGKWTWELLFGLSKNIGTDADSNGQYTIASDDVLGLCINEGVTRAMPTMCGIKYIENDNGVLSTSFYNSKTIELYEMVSSAISSNEGIVLNRSNSQNAKKFIKNQSVFCGGNLEIAKDIRAMEDDYGILINPKYSEDEDYISGSVGGTIFAIPVNAKDFEMSTILLEALGYYSYELIRPAFFEGTLKGQSARDPESYEMLDLIRNTLYIDFALSFANDFDIYYDAFDRRLDDNEITLTVWWNQNGSVYGAKFDEFMSKID